MIYLLFGLLALTVCLRFVVAGVLLFGCKFAGLVWCYCGDCLIWLFVVMFVLNLFRFDCFCLFTLIYMVWCLLFGLVLTALVALLFVVL